MEDNVTARNKTARIAGLLYLLLSITGAYDLVWVQSQIIVHGNAAATGVNMLTKEFLLRTGVVSEIIANVLFVFLVFYLYRLFNEINEHQAKIMVAFVLVQVPISLTLQIFKISSLLIFKGEIMKGLLPTQRPEMAMLFLDTYRYGLMILEVFWGLWLIPFGQLVYRSHFIPKVFGVLLIVGSAGYFIESLRNLILPHYESIVLNYIGVLYALGEFSIMFWLLIKGTRFTGIRLDTENGLLTS